MLLFEFDEKLPTVKTPTVGAIAHKHNVTVKAIRQQLTKGIKVEKEHTTDPKIAKEIALDHLAEFPDYYDRLETVEENVTDFPTQDRKRSVQMDRLAKRSSYYNDDRSPTKAHPDLRPKEPRLRLVPQK